MNTEITTKAALCPDCNNFHLIASIELFKTSKGTRKEFSQYVFEGFEVINVTTQEATKRFGYC